MLVWRVLLLAICYPFLLLFMATGNVLVIAITHTVFGKFLEIRTTVIKINFINVSLLGASISVV